VASKDKLLLELPGTLEEIGRPHEEIYDTVCRAATGDAVFQRRAMNRRAIYVCMAVFFALCWLSHYLARLAMEICNRQFLVTDGKTVRAMALIDWVAAHSWLAIAYIFLVLASVAFLQIRGRPPWTYWVTALLFCIPCFAYWLPCAFITGKLFLRP
jgi:hypothetical protein